MPKIYIGTSGWVYKEWGKKFFPKDLPAKEHLPFLAEQFNTVEVNSSFYHLLTKKSTKHWHDITPSNFVFAIKVSRFITHIKRMKGVRAAWLLFLARTNPLKEKRGPFLFQFPENFTGKKPEIGRIDKFLQQIQKDGDLRLAFEFRHANCFSEDMLEVLKKHRAALVFANSEKYPRAPLEDFSDFMYFRLHGPKKIFSSSYSTSQLKDIAETVQSFLNKNKDVYIYFNNDQHAHAPANAKLLMEFLK